MKAQASLEMVVGLIILLVVAGVVISIVIHTIKPPKPPEKIKIEEFKSECQSFCKDLGSLEYCTSYYNGQDWDLDGIKNEIVEVGQYSWSTCEDRVYCFLVEPCEDRFGSGLSALRRCKEMLCQRYLEKYEYNLTAANEELFDKISFSEKCNIDSVPEKDNWYKKVFLDGCSIT